MFKLLEKRAERRSLFHFFAPTGENRDGLAFLAFLTTLDLEEEVSDICLVSIRCHLLVRGACQIQYTNMAK